MKYMLAHSLILLSAFALITSSEAQETFQKSFHGDNFSTFIEGLNTNDGMFLCAGHEASDYDSVRHFNLTKTDQNGELIWSKEYASDLYSEVYSVTQLRGQDYIATGFAISDASISLLYLRTDPDGNISNTKRIYFPNAEYSGGNDVIASDDGGALLVGYYSEGAGDYNLYTIKIDENGNKDWSARYDGPNDWDADNYNTSAYYTTDGGFIMCSQSFIEGSHRNLLVVKIDSLGTVEWSKISTELDATYLSNIIETTDGSFIISLSDYNKIYLVKLDPFGNPIIEKSLSNSYQDLPGHISPTSDGGVLISYSDMSLFGSTTAFAKLNDMLVPQFAHHYNPKMHVYFLHSIAASDDGFTLVGTIYTDHNGRYRDNYIVKTDSYGETMCIDSVILLESENASVHFIDYPITRYSVFDSSVHVSMTATAKNEIVTTFCSTVGLDLPERRLSEWQIFPNPNAGTFQIKGSFEAKTIIDIYDVFGQKLFEQTFSPELYPSAIPLCLKQLVPGTYRVQVRSGSDLSVKNVSILN